METSNGVFGYCANPCLFSKGLWRLILTIMTTAKDCPIRTQPSGAEYRHRAVQHNSSKSKRIGDWQAARTNYEKSLDVLVGLRDRVRSARRKDRKSSISSKASPSAMLRLVVIKPSRKSETVQSMTLWAFVDQMLVALERRDSA
jgi:hypothetical protein